MSSWIDFKELRANLGFEQLLRHYGVEIKRKGNQHQGFCPLPNHNGKKNSPSFSANLERGIFQCFGCGAKGNVLEFAALMEGVVVEDTTALRSVGIELQKRFFPGHGRESPMRAASTAKSAPPVQAVVATPVVINAPLDFELKGLQQDHPYLLGRGFTEATTQHFGLGYCSRGMLRGRIAIPLHDQKGQLVGYSGRLVDDAAVSADNPKYRFPGKREREGKVYEFRKSRFVYNGDRIQGPVDELIVVEGFASVWWLHQNGFPNVVAVMGSDCSERQAEIIVMLVKPTGRIWILPDGDEAGERCAESLLALISPHRLVRWVKLENDRQPTEVSPGCLKNSFAS